MNCRRCRPWLLLIPLALLAGCQGGEEIREYQVDRLKPREPDRLLGAIVLRSRGENWFFKYVGPATTAADHEKEFEKLIETVRPADKEDSALTWTLPDGWRQEPGEEFRLATLCFGPGHGLEMSVAKSGGSVLDNVNRWLEQMGVREAKSEEELRERKIITKDLQSNGLNIIVVDVTGGGGGRGHRGMGRPPMAAPPEEPAEPRYDAPKGWQSAKPPSSIVRAAFRLPDSQEKDPEVTISTLRGDGGGLLPNYQRWQKQVGLEPASKLPRDGKTIEAAGDKVPYFDIVGPEGKDQKRILVAVVKHGGLSWYFKLLARADVVGKQQAAFEAFVKSVRF